MSDFICNILILGKTGTGKSSLLNYLCGQNFANVGSGKPVTGKGLYPYQATINNQTIRIFDSFGLEPGENSIIEWNNIIERSLQEHGIHKAIEDWFHSIIYCIQAGGGRVENIDIEIIKKFLHENYRLTIVLTKADQFNTEEDKQKLIHTLYNELGSDFTKSLKVISTCSEEKITRKGVTKSFGKDELISNILHDWKENVLQRIPKHIIEVAVNEIDVWSEELKNEIKKAMVRPGDSNNEFICTRIFNSAKDEFANLNTLVIPEELENTINTCRNAKKSLITVFDAKLDVSQFNYEVLGQLNTIKKLKTEKPISNIFNNLMSFSKKMQNKEKELLIGKIDDLASEMKQKIYEKEPSFYHIIDSAL